MKIFEILNYHGDQGVIWNIASAFTPDGVLKFPLDLKGMDQVEPRLDQASEFGGDDNHNPAMLGLDDRSPNSHSDDNSSSQSLQSFGTGYPRHDRLRLAE